MVGERRLAGNAYSPHPDAIKIRVGRIQVYQPESLAPRLLSDEFIVLVQEKVHELLMGKIGFGKFRSWLGRRAG